MDNDKYFKLVCIDISQNDKLNSFFQKLTRYSETKQTVLISTDKNYSFVIKPNLKCISNKILELEKCGVSIYCYNEILKEENYLDNNISVIDIFNEVSFKGCHINEEHIKLFLDILSNEGNPDYVRPKTKEEQEYYEHCENNCKALQNASKYWLRYGYDRFVKSSKLPEKVLNTREIFKENVKLQSASLNFESLSKKDIKGIIELYNLVCETKTRYQLYSESLKKGQAFIKEESRKIYSQALTSILENSMCEIDMDEIIENLFVILIYRTIRLESDIVTSATLFDKIEFNPNAVDWFLNFQWDKLNELYQKLSMHLDVAVKTGIEIVLKI